jgi:Domain of unknown function (DUF4265)
MEKVSFALDVQDGWPPVAVEHVWCEQLDGIYQLKNAPFFIQGLAYGDKFTAVPDSVNGCIFEFTVVEPSGHSLVRVLELEGKSFDSFKQELLVLGCSVEGLPNFGLHSIDIPALVDAKTLNDSLGHMEACGLSLAFPVWRHDVHAA